jgi:hypothetical protein
MKGSHFACFLVSLLVLSCADNDTTATVDAEWNLTCPDDREVGCGSLASGTCLSEDDEGVVGPGWRSIVGRSGDTACTGDKLIASCQAVERPSGVTEIHIEANIGDAFAFELAGAAVDSGDGSMTESTCRLRILEDGAEYGGLVTGGCGTEAPSMEQPCQLSNIETGGGVVTFGLECASLISATSANGFDLGALGGGPTTMRFSNCAGF